MNQRAVSAMLLLGAALGFGSLGPLATVAYAAGMAAPTFVALRAAAGAVLLGLVVLALHRPTIPLSSIPCREQLMLGAAILLNGAMNLALFGAFQAAPVPAVLAVVFTYPVIVALMATALGRERLTALRILGLLLAVGGVVLIMADGLGAADMTLIGLALAGVAATAQASYLVVARAGFPSVPAEQAIILVLCGGSLMALPLAVAVDSVAGWGVDGAAWAAVLAASIFGTALAKVWVLRSVRSLGSTRSAVILLSEPVFGTLLATATLGQPFTLGQAIGGLMVLGAAVIAQRPAPGGAAIAVND